MAQRGRSLIIHCLWFLFSVLSMLHSQSSVGPIFSLFLCASWSMLSKCFCFVDHMVCINVVYKYEIHHLESLNDPMILKYMTVNFML